MIHLPFFNSNILQSSIYFRRIRSEFENTRSITDPKIIKLKLGNVIKNFRTAAKKKREINILTKDN